MLLIKSRDKENEIRVNATKFPWKGFASGAMKQNPKTTEWMEEGGRAESRDADTEFGEASK